MSQLRETVIYGANRVGHVCVTHYRRPCLALPGYISQLSSPWSMQLILHGDWHKVDPRECHNVLAGPLAQQAVRPGEAEARTLKEIVLAKLLLNHLEVILKIICITCLQLDIEAICL